MADDDTPTPQDPGAAHGPQSRPGPTPERAQRAGNDQRAGSDADDGSGHGAKAGAEAGGERSDDRRANRSQRPRDEHRGPVRPLLALASLLPLAAAVGVIAMTPASEPTAVTRAETDSRPGAMSSRCPGPLQVPDALLEEAGDAELSVEPPSTSVGIGSVALEPDSSVLFGRVSSSETLQEDDGTVRAPVLTTEDSEGDVVEDTTASADLGVGVQQVPTLEDSAVVRAASAEGGRPVADTVQSTATTSGDFRSLALTRCAEPTTDASFLGASTASGDSSVLVLRNPTQRPATASVQVWTEDGPASMAGRSQVVVAPGDEERVLLESVAGGHEAVGVRASVLGAPLSMHIQTTERDGLTPGGAEILDPLPGAGVEQVMPGVNVLGTEPELVLTNPQGSDTTASVAVSGADGPIAAAGLEDVEVPAGTVVRVPLTGLKDGSYTVSVTAADPVLAVTRSSALGAELSGDTLGTPVDFTLVSSAPALGTSGVLALPAEGAAGGLTLTAETAGSVSIVPLAADGSAGTPVEVDLAADASVWVSSRALAVDGAPASGLTVVPEVPGAVRASWMQRESDGADGVLLSSLPMLSAQQSGETLTVRVQD
ncbi:DUF5719 family protein [Brachybacterium alimentarium]|uniref:DUF5719 family protein n=1 Tax=Brachybacterium alimentarium TaxID=47845 RepID=UPI003FD375C8